MSKFFEKLLSQHEIVTPGQLEKKKDEVKKDEVKKNEVKSLFPVYPRSIVSNTAGVNKSAKLKSDIRYLWNKFVINSGGPEEATRRCYNDLVRVNQQGGFCDVSGVNFSNPAQAISQVVGNIKEKQEELKKQQESKTEQQAAPQSAPAPENKPE